MSLMDAADKFNESFIRITMLRVEFALAAGMDIAALAKTRIINKRVNHFDNEFGEYAASTWRQKKAKKGNNRQINFSETNRMWATTLPSVAEVTPNQVVLLIKPTDAQRAEVFDIHQERFGPLMLLNDRENLIFLQIYEAKILKELP